MSPVASGEVFDMTSARSTDQFLSVRQAAFIGVGAMVGAGIFALLGAAGEVAGAAVWISFLIAGAVAGLQGYSFAKFGARYPSAAGLFEYLYRGFGEGHTTGITAWLTYVTNCIITAMVAVSFGSYASAMFTDGDPVWAKIFAALILVVMTAVNVVGSQLVAKAQTVIVYVVLGILVVFAIVTLATMQPALLAPSGYPPLRDITASVALTFFAFLGFGIITFTAKDLRNPARQLPRAMLLALSIATVIYVAIALGVFGTLPVQDVIASGGTALAVAAQPTLGDAGYLLMSITALFATAGATNAGLYPAIGLCDQLAANGTFPPALGRRIAQRVSVGLLVAAALSLVLALGFALNAIAAIGSAVALLVFGMCTVAHFRVRAETGARLSLLILAVTTAAIALVAFLLDLIINDPVSVVAMLVIVVLAVIMDLGWKRIRARRAPANGPAHTVTPPAAEDSGGDPSPSEHGGPAPLTP
jgi:amino acid transporter